jgi:predicted Rossmann-fold nucleotide-binding protein
MSASEMKRVLVCGGREYADTAAVDAILGALRDELGDFVVVHGGARGADNLAAEWADQQKLPTMKFPANWEQQGRAAGTIRNALMLRVGRPHLVVAFPGGRGTADMIRRAEAAEVEVRRIAH